jgi:3',5'-nucleoside bisphosphate phosphatase
MRTYIDLHIHSSHSDGIYPPSALVTMAAKKGLRAIAITDHDSVSGVDEALVSGRKHGVEVIPATEFSIGYGNLHDVHLLGYYIDHRDKGLLKILEEFRNARDSRGKAIIAKINEKLASERKALISYDEVLDLADGSLSRLHIARLLVDRGLARHVQDAFNRFLQPCDVPKRYFPLEEAIEEIRGLRGIAVLAHPHSITDQRSDLAALIRELAAKGLDGIEVFNNLCYKDDMIFLESLCHELGLVMTGGSDYHGYENDNEIGIGRGGLAVAYRLLEPIKALASARGAVL